VTNQLHRHLVHSVNLDQHTIGWGVPTE
jgi:hypothetical protein